MHPLLLQFITHVLQKVLSGEAISLFVVSNLAIQFMIFFQFNRILLSECINNPFRSHLLQLQNQLTAQYLLHKSSSFRLA